MTGAETEVWLVRTVGAQVTAIAVSLATAAARDGIGADRAMAIGSCAALALVDLVYAARRIISLIYLAGALGEGVLIACGRSRSPGEESRGISSESLLTHAHPR